MANCIATKNRIEMNPVCLINSTIRSLVCGWPLATSKDQRWSVPWHSRSQGQFKYNFYHLISMDIEATRASWTMPHNHYGWWYFGHIWWTDEWLIERSWNCENSDLALVNREHLIVLQRRRRWPFIKAENCHARIMPDTWYVLTWNLHLFYESM